MTYQKSEITEKLATSQTWLEKGVLAIFKRQTNDEQAVNDTRHLNSRGFSSADASYLSYVAKWLLSGKHLSGYHLFKTRRRMMKYAGQLTVVANGS